MDIEIKDGGTYRIYPIRLQGVALNAYFYLLFIFLFLWKEGHRLALLQKREVEATHTGGK